MSLALIERDGLFALAGFAVGLRVRRILVGLTWVTLQEGLQFGRQIPWYVALRVAVPAGQGSLVTDARAQGNELADMTLEILIVLLLILVQGLFAMGEMAIVSSRRARLKQMADEGDKGAAGALSLAEHPSRFFSTVQIGLTLIGISPAPMAA